MPAYQGVRAVPAYTEERTPEERMGRELNTQIDIDAPVERVWSVLTDFAAYPEWNPFILSAEGSLAVGE